MNNIKEFLEKLKDEFFSMKYSTKAFFITILSFYILKIFWSEEVDDTCINPDIMWSNIITSVPRYILHSFVHANILHIVFNSIALIYFFTKFENQIGSVLLIHIVLVFTILIAVLYSFSAKILSIFFISYWMESCTTGISGVLFSFITIESLQNKTNKNIFREIPSKYNPWILLVVTQLIWPKASFLGHLSGITIGYLYNMGLLDKLMLTHTTIYDLEGRMPFSYGNSTFISHPSPVTLPIHIPNTPQPEFPNTPQQEFPPQPENENDKNGNDKDIYPTDSESEESPKPIYDIDSNRTPLLDV